MFVARGGAYTVDVDARQVDLVGVQGPDGDDIFGLHDGQAGGLGHEHPVGLCGAPEDAVPGLVDLPGPDDGHVPPEGRLHEVPPAAEDSSLAGSAGLQDGVLAGGGVPGSDPDGDLPGLDEGAGPRAGEEGGDAGPRGPEAFGDGPLRAEFDGHPAVVVLLTQGSVVADERHDHPGDLPGGREFGQTVLSRPGVVGNHGQVAYTLFADGVDQGF